MAARAYPSSTARTCRPAACTAATDARAHRDRPARRPHASDAGVDRQDRPRALLCSTATSEENDNTARQVTDRLYARQEHRLEQELLLASVGVRAIRAYCAVTRTPAPTGVHTNEGHAGFPRCRGASGIVDGYDLTFDEELQAVRAARCSPPTRRCPRASTASRATSSPGIWPACRAWPSSVCSNSARSRTPHLQHGAHGPAHRSGAAKGVSLLHGRVSREMFADLCRARPSESRSGGDERRARAHLDGARDPRHRRARSRSGDPVTGGGWEAIDNPRHRAVGRGGARCAPGAGCAGG